jgi:predicted O-methyltransferase YrrM
MDLIDEKINDFAEAHTTDESDILKRLNRDTWSNVIMPRMLSGHLQGRILSTFSHMIRPDRILEIGTYTGYSAICLAEGLNDNGLLYTIDINEELAGMVNKYVAESGFQDKIRCLTGDAMTLIPEINEEFDLVFIDADKENYSNYFDLVLPKLRKGGFIIADNVLWSGKVLDDPADMDQETEALAAFNEKVHRSDAVENVLFPVRDGLMVCRKR